MNDQQLPPLSVPYEKRVATETTSADRIGWQPYETWDKGVATDTASADGFVREQRENLVQRWLKNVSLLGNFAQVVSAVAAIVTMSVAIYGVSAAVPFFQNRLLSEQVARLQLSERDMTILVVCERLQTHALVTTESRTLWTLESITSVATKMPAWRDLVEPDRKRILENWARVSSDQFKILEDIRNIAKDMEKPTFSLPENANISREIGDELKKRLEAIVQLRQSLKSAQVELERSAKVVSFAPYYKACLEARIMSTDTKR